MGDQGETTPDAGLSRRAALRAGVAVGVGAAVWSGVSITSLGGTPAYAVACSNPVYVDLTGQAGCRNTDQGACKKPYEDYFGYHPLNAALPAGFSIENNLANGTCCNEVSTLNPPTFKFDATLYKCAIFLEFSNSNDGKCTNPFWDWTSGVNTTGSIPLSPVPLNCDPYLDSIGVFTPNSVYTIYAKCVSTDAGACL